MKHRVSTRELLTLLGLIAILVVLPTVGFGEVPQQISYQGRLTDAGGVPMDGSPVMSFSIYDVPVGGTALWGESQTVTVAAGIYNVQIGQDPAGNPFPSNLFDGQRWLGVAVDADAEMVPRQLLTSTPFAMKAAVADNADTLDGIDSTGLDQSAHVPRTDNPHGVTAAQTGAVTLSDITWGNLSNVPDDFADGVDNTGIITEVDPTVPDSVKDGVSWSELSGIPDGFDDGVDDVGGTITGVATVNPLVGGGTSGNVSISVDIPFEIMGNEDPAVISASNNYPTGYGVYGEASNSGNYMNSGGYFTAKGKYGRGIEATATGTDGTNHGGVFIAAGLTGRGVYGEASNKGNFENYGGYFKAAGLLGKGVFGEATSVSGVGVFGKATGDAGAGVYGEAANVGSNSVNWGGYFTAAGASGRGVTGYASNGNGLLNHGGYFIADGKLGRGVYSEASNTEGTNTYGGHFVSRGTAGYGVVGEAAGTTGQGVKGYVTGASGRGVSAHAVNDGDVENYGGYFTSNGQKGIAVYAKAEANTTSLKTNYGGYFVANGQFGKGVYGKATGANATGVKGEASSTSFGTAYGGYFSAFGSSSRGVCGSAEAGIGVEGYATDSGDVQNYGGHFAASGKNGRGVHATAWGQYGRAFEGIAYGTTGTNHGGYFEANGPTGRGVYGKATGSSGTGVRASGEAYNFLAAGPGTPYGTESSIRWKQNVQEIEGALEMVMQMRGVYFDWDENHGGRHGLGFIAEEVGEYVPEIVVYEEDSEYASGMDYSLMTPILLQAIKEQQGIISELRAEMDVLKEEIAVIKSGL